jgi:DNA polymerase
MEVSEELAQTAIDAYRQTYKKVPAFWRDMETAARLTTLTGKSHETGKFRFSREREFLYLHLPSGRKLGYHKPGTDEKGLYYYAEDSQSYTYVKKHTYGGRLVENAIQAIARDILAHGILGLEEAGFPVVLTVHDENVIEVPLQTNHKDKVINIMCDLPDWAKGCPIDAEGFECERYRKG